VDRIPVGALQRREIEASRAFPKGAFEYNEVPTSSCHTFCWKARHFFDVPFFCPPAHRSVCAEIDVTRVAADRERDFSSATAERDFSSP
jgi:hypothetical protein